MSGPPEELPGAIRLDLPAHTRHLALIGACIGATLEGLDGVAGRERLIDEVRLAVHELCANVIEHAYADAAGGRLTITLAPDEGDRRLTIVVRDTGRPFDPATVPEPDVVGQVRGYGLFLLRQLMETVRYEACPDGNRWELTRGW